MGVLQNNKVLKIALVISLALNLLVIGAIGSFFGSKRHKDVRLDAENTQQGDRGSRLSGPIGMVLSGFDRKDRRAFGRELRETVGKPGASRPDPKALLDDLKSVLTADAFNRDRFVAVIGANTQQALARSTAAQNALADFLENLTADERTQIAEKMRFPRGLKKK